MKESVKSDAVLLIFENYFLKRSEISILISDSAETDLHTVLM